MVFLDEIVSAFKTRCRSIGNVADQTGRLPCARGRLKTSIAHSDAARSSAESALSAGNRK
jgi:hypothetical protein